MKLPPARRINPALSQTLDASRWVAAALVVVYHVRLNVLVEPDQIAPMHRSLLQHIVYAATDCGPQAVIWFFVISGFLVGGKIAADVQKNRFDLRSYSYDRLTRLYIVLLPAMVTCCGLDLIRVHVFGLNAGAGSETAASYAPWTFVANLLCLQTIHAPTAGSNVPLWSLACEGWYYVLFPLMMLVRLPARTGAIALLAIGLVVALLAPNPKIFLFFVFWLLGVGLRFCPLPLMRSNLLAWSLAAGSAMVYPFFAPHLKFLAMLAIALTFANILLTAMYHTGAVSALGSRTHALLAGFSYSLYLTHAPVLHFVNTFGHGRADPRLMLQPEALSYAMMLGLTVLLFIFGWLFSLFTEARTARIRLIFRRTPAHETFSPSAHSGD
jgi:peptidoglycan/LPS O-acetylase OafA/YrhL